MHQSLEKMTMLSYHRHLPPQPPQPPPPHPKKKKYPPKKKKKKKKENYVPPNPVNHAPISSSHNVPSLHDFLCALDKEQGEDNEFQALESVFQEQKIKVPHIKDLSDAQFVQLGITKIGWQIALRQESQKYA
jgi:hypothetical protein